MILIECIKMAFTSIRVNKLRSFLTMLGIIIGISSVIIITTIGNTLQGTMGGVFDKIGMNYLYIQLTTKDENSEDLKPTEDDLITDDMVEALVDKYPEEYSIYRNEYFNSGRVLCDNGNYIDVYVNGSSPACYDFFNTKLIKGRFPNQRDEDEGRYTAVVSDIFAEKYDNGEQIIGRPVSISMSNSEELTFYIVGVYKTTKTIGEKFDPDAPTEITVPNSVVRSLKGVTEKKGEYAIVLYKRVEGVKDPEQHALEFFQNIYSEAPTWTVNVDSMNQFAEMIDTAMTVLTLAFSVIAAISLLVGGIGVMNIMLVSIVERTKEIGIRKAIGAKRSAILFQFVVEAIIICLIGGIIGILSGLGISWLVGAVGQYMVKVLAADASDMLNIVIKPQAKPIIISLLTSTAIGVVFGYYPAKRAAKMDPIDALRFDG